MNIYLLGEMLRMYNFLYIYTILYTLDPQKTAKWYRYDAVNSVFSNDQAITACF